MRDLASVNSPVATLRFFVPSVLCLPDLDGLDIVFGDIVRSRDAASFSEALTSTAGSAAK